MRCIEASHELKKTGLTLLRVSRVEISHLPARLGPFGRSLELPGRLVLFISDSPRRQGYEYGTGFVTRHQGRVFLFLMPKPAAIRFSTISV
jgi:hypothetical protein